MLYRILFGPVVPEPKRRQRYYKGEYRTIPRNYRVQGFLPEKSKVKIVSVGPASYKPGTSSDVIWGREGS